MLGGRPGTYRWFQQLKSIAHHFIAKPKPPVAHSLASHPLLAAKYLAYQDSYAATGAPATATGNAAQKTGQLLKPAKEQGATPPKPAQKKLVCLRNPSSTVPKQLGRTPRTRERASRHSHVSRRRARAGLPPTFPLYPLLAHTRHALHRLPLLRDLPTTSSQSAPDVETSALSTGYTHFHTTLPLPVSPTPPPFIFPSFIVPIPSIERGT
ncbi:hypothetical protein VDGL01_02864 [Verticillium dahliae]